MWIVQYDYATYDWQTTCYWQDFYFGKMNHMLLTRHWHWCHMSWHWPWQSGQHVTDKTLTLMPYTWHWHWQSEPHVAVVVCQQLNSGKAGNQIGQTGQQLWPRVAKCVYTALCPPTHYHPCLGPPTASLSLSLWSQLTLTCSYKHILYQVTSGHNFIH